MKLIKQLSVIVLISTLAILTSCNFFKYRNYDQIEIDTEYSLFVPKTFEALTGLNRNATLQMGSQDTSLFMIVIKNSKQETYDVIDQYNLQDLYSKDLDGYFSMILERMENNAGIFEISASQENVCNELTCISSSFKNLYGDKEITYSISVFDTQDFFYQIMMWTNSTNLEKNKDYMETISESFQKL